MGQNDLIAFRVSDTLKGELDDVVEGRPEVDRSQYIREAIRRQLQREEVNEYKEVNS